MSHRRAGYAAGQHLIARGYRRFGYVGHDWTADRRARLRYDGLCEALGAAGLSLVAHAIADGPSSVATGRAQTAQLCDMATVDVSFISLSLVLPAVARVLSPKGEVIALVKPQFEVGRGKVGKGGVVRDRHLHRDVLLTIAKRAGECGLYLQGIIVSPLKGPKGNTEFVMHLTPVGPAQDAERCVAALFPEGEGG